MTIEPIGGLTFHRPDITLRRDGRTRRAGFEIELLGVKPADVAAIVASLFEGTAVRVNPHLWRIEDTRFGAFRVELDWQFLHRQDYRTFLERAGIEVTASFEDFVNDLAHRLVPTEIVCPPIEVTSLSSLDALEEALRWEGAEGSDASVLNALGLQINVELVDESVETILAHLRAFIDRYAWLEQEIDPGVTRRVTRFATPFPDDYAQLVLDPSYAPTAQQFTDDYLEHNPTRNRALDLLPMLAHLDEERVLARAREPDLAKKRPALHYRLPSARLDDPDSSIALEWNRWLEVEARAEHWLNARVAS